MVTKTVEAIADTISEAILPSRRQPLTEEQIRARIESIERASEQRRNEYRRIVGRRRRWVLLGEDELRALTRLTIKHEGNGHTGKHGRQHASSR
jgi:hypothetical protein